MNWGKHVKIIYKPPSVYHRILKTADNFSFWFLGAVEAGLWMSVSLFTVFSIGSLVYWYIY